MILIVILLVIFFFVFKFMKIAHESFTEKDKLDDITHLDKYQLDKSKDFLVKKLVRDIKNDCYSDTKKSPRDVAELMFYDKDDYNDIYNFTDLKNKKYRNKLCYW